MGQQWSQISFISSWGEDGFNQKSNEFGSDLDIWIKNLNPYSIKLIGFEQSIDMPTFITALNFNEFLILVSKRKFLNI